MEHRLHPFCISVSVVLFRDSDMLPREKEPRIPTSTGRGREYSWRAIDRKLTLPYIVNIKIFKYLFC